MSYTKHNFLSGNILYAEQMKDIDDQVYLLTENGDAVAIRVGRLETNTAPATDAEVTEMLNRVLELGE